MIALLLVTQNEAEVLAWNLRHHLDWGIDHIAVGDNRSDDATRDVVREFGDAVSYQLFPSFHQRQTVRHEMLVALHERFPIEWAGIADTDEFWWLPDRSMAEALAETPPEIVAVNFDAKLFVPTQLDGPEGAVFMRRRYRTATYDTPLHTSYREGKTWYRSSFIESQPADHFCNAHEHSCRLIPHDRYRYALPAVHHYMIQDEDQFVKKVARLIEWVEPPTDELERAVWDATPAREKDLPDSMAAFKREWWGVYKRGGEAAVRDYYRNVYTLPADRVREAVAAGELAEDDAFLEWTTARYGEGAQ